MGRVIPRIALFLCLFVGLGLIPVSVGAQALSPDDRAKLQAQYDQIQQEIAQWQTVLENTRQKKNSLTGDVTLLTAQIKQAEAQIKQKNIVISQLSDQISQKTATISSLDDQINLGLESLGKLIREKNESDTQSLALMLLTEGSLSDFFSDVSARDTVQKGLQVRFDQIQTAKTQVQKERQDLNDKKNSQVDAKYVVQVKQQQITEDKTQKDQLLSLTKQQEQQYGKVLADRQRQAEAIRSALFDLRDAQGIPFSTALTYAQYASQKTGVRPAMILAILSQESDLGSNIGSCYVTNLDTGDGVKKNTNTVYEKVMKAPRDTGPFQTITAALGFQWATTPVSCPLRQFYSSSRGYGGAMGPSQFIPSTWQLFDPQLQTLLGVSLTNPWDPKHAIMATALYMSELGADGGTYTAERNAACKYYSGRSCGGSGPANTFYGNAVIAKAADIQKNIDFLNNL